MKYMLTIQHDDQKVAYIEFTAKSNAQALKTGEDIYKTYQTSPVFTPRMPYISGNFSGQKPRILNHHISKWVESSTATNANGSYCGGYWSTLRERE